MVSSNAPERFLQMSRTKAFHRELPFYAAGFTTMPEGGAGQTVAPTVGLLQKLLMREVELILQPSRHNTLAKIPFDLMPPSPRIAS